MNDAARARYLAETVATASPGQLLVMLYDRLIRDLVQAEEALRTGGRQAASAPLMHAQEIVGELRGTLDLTVWDGAAGLAQVYGYVFKLLIQANVKADATLVVECREILEPLRDAWREALAITRAARETAEPVAARTG